MSKRRPKESEFQRTIGRELRSLLSVDPPPGFEFRLRARVEHNPARLSWNLRWIIGAAAAVSTIVMVVFMFQLGGGGGQAGQGAQGSNIAQHAANSEAPPAASLTLPASQEIQCPAPPRLRSIRHRIIKTGKVEPQLMIAANEASALRRLLSGELTELPRPFHREVRQFQAPETTIEPLAPPAPVKIDPIEPLEPAAEQAGR